MRKLFFVLAAGFLPVPVFAQVPVTVHADQKALLRSDDPRLAANKKLVFDFWREVFPTRNMDLAPKYMAEDCIQHNPLVPTAREPFMDLFGQFERQPVRPEIGDLVMLVAEGDILILAFRREFPDPQQTRKTYTTTWLDMSRIKDGKIAEDWDYGIRTAK